MATIRNGIITTDIRNLDEAYSVKVQADGKILVVGNTTAFNSYPNADYDVVLLRYNSNGSLDTSFSGNGKVITDMGTAFDLAYSVAIQTNGKILVAGTNDVGFTLARYNNDGSLDTSFDNDGKVITAVGNYASIGFRSVTVQADGKILVAGESYDGNNHFDFALVRYNNDGSLDTSFDGDGKVTTLVGQGRHSSGASVITQTDNKILVAGYSDWGLPTMATALVRYNSDGSLDTSFGNGDGIVTTAVSDEGAVYSVTLQTDGKILVAGESHHKNSDGSWGYWDFALVRYNADGSLDASFGNNGIVISAPDVHGGSAYSVTLQADNKILVAGGSADINDNYNFALIRYNTDGSLDTSFDGDGIVTTDIDAAINDSSSTYSVTVQKDGKILVVGNSYDDNGTVDNGYDDSSDIVLVRYNPDGSLDTTFNGGEPILPTWQETLTKSGGYYSTFADLSKAAYQLASDETTGQGINYVKPYADEAWARVKTNWNVLTSDNLSVNSGTLGTDGIYHNANAAAFAAQCENTLVLSFRGTNDNDADPGLPFVDANTPDEIDWTDMGNTVTGHYGKFFDFIQAVDKYVADNGIQNVYVTGHSLGGAMVLAYMLDHKDSATVKYQAVTFAAPGYNMIGAGDARTVCVEMDGDIVHSFGYHQGHIITINSDIKDSDTGLSYGKNFSTDYHSMDIYMEASHALDSQLPDTSINTNTSIHGVNLTSFDGYWNAEVTLPMSEATGTQSYNWKNEVAPHYSAMTGNNTLSGAGKNIMLGGIGNDSYDVDDALDVIIEKANAGKDGVTSSISFSLPDNVENLTLKNGTSLLGFNQSLNGIGNTSANVLNGNNAKNTLTGLNGNDILSGAKGDDILIGGLGKDKLTGGAGADIFKFDTVKDSGLTPTTRDVITDFNHAQGDKIDLSGIDANTAVKGNNAFLPVENGFTDVTFNLTNALYFNKSTHILYGNNDTDATADFSILITGVTTLSTSDFIL